METAFHLPHAWDFYTNGAKAGLEKYWQLTDIIDDNTFKYIKTTKMTTN